MPTPKTPDRKYAPVPGLLPAQVYTPIGDGVTLGVNADDRLVIEDAFVRMDLGRFTQRRLDDLKSYLDQLSPHIAK